MFFKLCLFVRTFFCLPDYPERYERISMKFFWGVRRGPTAQVTIDCILVAIWITIRIQEFSKEFFIDYCDSYRRQEENTKINGESLNSLTTF